MAPYFFRWSANDFLDETPENVYALCHSLSHVRSSRRSTGVARYSVLLHRHRAELLNSRFADKRFSPISTTVTFLVRVTSFSLQWQVAHCKVIYSNKARPKAAGDGIFGRFSNFDKRRPEVAGHAAYDITSYFQRLWVVLCLSKLRCNERSQATTQSGSRSCHAQDNFLSETRVFA